MVTSPRLITRHTGVASESEIVVTARLAAAPSWLQASVLPAKGAPGAGFTCLGTPTKLAMVITPPVGSTERSVARACGRPAGEELCS